MKKLFLLSVAAALSTGAFAQAINSSVIFPRELTNKMPVTKVNPGYMPASLTRINHSDPHARTTAITDTTARWYDYFSTVDLLSGNVFTNTATNYRQLLNIWFDSTILQRFNTGYSPVNYISVAQVVAPTYSYYNDTTFLNALYSTSGTSSLVSITDTNTYQVDSVSVVAAYLKQKPGRTQADSLIISVAPTTGTYRYEVSTAPFVSNYTADDTLVAFAPYYVDSIRKAAVNPASTGYPSTTWTVALTPDMGDVADPTTGNITLHNYSFAVPTPVRIPAGSRVAVSFTFKSTDSYVKGVDSIYEYDRFMPIYGYEYPYPTGGYMTYRYGADHSDKNGSSLMFYFDSSNYYPTIDIQGFNLPSAKYFSYEYAAISAFLECSTCTSINTTASTTPPDTTHAVYNVNGKIKSISAYPNPAVNQLNIPFTLDHSYNNVTVTLANAIGQVVGTQKLDNVNQGKAVFNTSNLAGGIYFYTLQADGLRYTDRVVVSH